jgi:hypothetical protein
MDQANPSATRAASTLRLMHEKRSPRSPTVRIRKHLARLHIDTADREGASF